MDGDQALVGAAVRVDDGDLAVEDDVEVVALVALADEHVTRRHAGPVAVLGQLRDVQLAQPRERAVVVGRLRQRCRPCGVDLHAKRSRPLVQRGKRPSDYERERSRGQPRPAARGRMDPLSLLWLFFILASLQPAFQRQYLLAQRRRALSAISREREATVMTLIHRQESMSLLGFPIVRYIDIDDAEGVLRAINETPPGRAIEIILHTPGGLVIAAQQIAAALADHDGRVTAVDPALRDERRHADRAGRRRDRASTRTRPWARSTRSWASIRPPRSSRSPQLPGDHDDQTLIMADVGRKAIAQVEGFTERLLERHMTPERARDVAHLLATGVWTHDHPLLARDLLRSACRSASACRSWSASLMDALPAAARTHPGRRVLARPALAVVAATPGGPAPGARADRRPLALAPAVAVPAGRPGGREVDQRGDRGVAVVGRAPDEPGRHVRPVDERERDDARVRQAVGHPRGDRDDR